MRGELSAPQRRCIIDATIDPLRPYRRGFSRSKTGPFHDKRTVSALLKQGALRLINERNTKFYGCVTARAS